MGKKQKPCETCGEWIYIGRGPTGKPTPYEVASNERHDCYLSTRSMSIRSPASKRVEHEAFAERTFESAHSGVIQRPGLAPSLFPIGLLAIFLLFLIHVIKMAMEMLYNFIASHFPAL